MCVCVCIYNWWVCFAAKKMSFLHLNKHTYIHTYTHYIHTFLHTDDNYKTHTCADIGPHTDIWSWAKIALYVHNCNQDLIAPGWTRFQQTLKELSVLHKKGALNQILTNTSLTNKLSGESSTFCSGSEFVRDTYGGTYGSHKGEAMTCGVTGVKVEASSMGVGAWLHECSSLLGGHTHTYVCVQMYIIYM